MSIKTKMKRAAKEAKRLPSTYVDPTKPKPRETLWRRYRETGLKYDPYEVDPKVIENRKRAAEQRAARQAEADALRAKINAEKQLDLGLNSDPDPDKS